MKKKTLINNLISSLILISIICIVIIGFKSNKMPKVKGHDTPLTEFSAIRAMQHIKCISEKPHPTGSKEIENVRRYIISQLDTLGYSPILQKEMIFVEKSQRACNIVNIIVRIPGSQNTKSVVVMGHYDSVDYSFGASDDGSAVGAMLETLRILKHEKQHKNDIIFVFTDAEEIGLIGAKAFHDKHKLAQNIGLILNFEASGTKGQSLMFETNDNNSWLISEFADVAPYPIANSFSIEIYKRMPNYTDYTIFKKDGTPGLNFAYIESRFDYHTEGDNIENTSSESVQHHGSYMLSLTKHFANINLNSTNKGNSVFFNTIGYGFIHYSYKWILPINIIIFMLLAIVIIYGIRKNRLKIREILYGIVTFLIQVFVAPFISYCLIHIIYNYYLGGDSRLIYYNYKVLLLGFAGLTVAISILIYYIIKQGVKVWHVLTLAVLTIILTLLSGTASVITIILPIIVYSLMYLLFRKRSITKWSITTGILLCWTIINFTIGYLMPGVSFIVAWPLLFAIIPLLLFTILENKHLSLQIVIMIISGIPTLIWLSGLSLMFLISMGPKMIWGSSLIVVLLISLITPLIYRLIKVYGYITISYIAVFGIVFTISGSVNLEYTKRHKKQNSIVYATNANNRSTFWYTYDNKPDAWTKQFITEQPDTTILSDFFYTKKSVLMKSSPLAPLKQPIVIVDSNTVTDSTRLLSINIKSQRDAQVMYIRMRTKSEYLGIKMNENKDFKQLRSSRSEVDSYDYWFWLYAPNINNVIKIQIKKSCKLELNISDIDYKLPSLQTKNFSKRYEYMMPNGDMTIVCKRFSL